MNNIRFSPETVGYEFWDVKGTIDLSKLYTFLEKEGFGLYYPDNEQIKKISPLLIQIKDNFVNEVNENYIRRICFLHLSRFKLDDEIMRQIRNSLFSKNQIINYNNLLSLHAPNLIFLDDTAKTSYVFFKNGFVEINPDNIQLRNYKETKSHIWQGDILPFKFILAEPQNILKGDFSNFMEEITKRNNKHDKKRVRALASIIGYLCHRYKDRTRSPAIILMDADPSESAKGRTGKTLISQAIKKVRKTHIEDGKSYDNRKTFKFSGVDINSNLIVFDDVKRKFDFEALFSIITTGITIEKKYKDAIHLPFEKSPKIMLTTNYAINGQGSSFNARAFEFEISNTFNDTYTPIDKYKKRFFDDWLPVEWNLFLNLIVKCIQIYLKNGLIATEPINMKFTKLISQTNQDFVDFCEEEIQVNTKYDKRILHDKFIINYYRFRGMSQRIFTEWLKYYGNYREAEIRESHSNNTRYIEFIIKNTT